MTGIQSGVQRCTDERGFQSFVLPQGEKRENVTKIKIADFGGNVCSVVPCTQTHVVFSFTMAYLKARKKRTTRKFKTYVGGQY
jgi:hypothetical protein